MRGGCAAGRGQRSLGASAGGRGAPETLLRHPQRRTPSTQNPLRLAVPHGAAK